MIKSMTGFGRERQIIGGHEILVEIRTVNHRYFEFSSKIPRGYMYLEEKLKSLIQDKLTRGKVEVSLSIYNVEGKEVEVSVNPMVVSGYVAALRAVKDCFNLTDNLSLSDIFKMQDAFNVTKPEIDENIMTLNVRTVASKALDKLVSMREKEGERLKADILERVLLIEELVLCVEKYSPETTEAYRVRLFEKMKEILADSKIEEQRILLEAAIFSEKTAINEETVRLKSHFLQLREMLNTEDGVGRKLDFLLQEINREVNTIGSKAQDLRITKTVVDLKSEIEKIREQIQNIE